MISVSSRFRLNCRAFLLLSAICTLAFSAPQSAPAAASCQPQWVPTFGSLPGLANGVASVAFYDDGTGPALFTAGTFYTAGGVPALRVAKWDGVAWSPLGSGLTSSNGTFPVVNALTVFDDGSGPALYAGGTFDRAGGILARGIARWNGTAWSAVGTGHPTAVSTLLVHDDGTGPALYAEKFRWNGTSWQLVGTPPSGTTLALASFDDGTGQALYMAGSFSGPALFVARWDGATWTALDTGLSTYTSALVVHDDGSGPALYCGSYTGSVLRWNGSSWTALPATGIGRISTLGSYAVGGVRRLCAGGADAPGGGSNSGVRFWDGVAWSTPGDDVHGTVTSFVQFDDGSGQSLFATGGFRRIGDLSAGGIARWDGSAWSALGTGSALAGRVRAVVAAEEAEGPALYAAVDENDQGSEGSRIGRWDGATWSTLGGWFDSTAYALEIMDLGQGPELYVGGAFTTVGGVTMRGVARWTGSAWAPLGVGLLPTSSSPFPLVRALLAFDDGTGMALYATGCFGSVGPGANNIAKWNGTNWSPLGGGISNCGFTLGVFDDGAGPRLHVGGVFTFAGGLTANRIARWDSGSWSTLINGITSGSVREVHALLSLDDGTGPALYVAGQFAGAGGLPANDIARWNGTSWSTLGAGVSGTDILAGSIHALAAIDDGTGPHLHAGGTFTIAGGLPATRIARWDAGTGWSALGSGVSQDVDVMTTFDPGLGDGPALFVGGYFATAFESGDAYLAQWQPSAGSAADAFCAGDGSASPCPCANDGAPGRGCANSLFADGARLRASGRAHVTSDSLVLKAQAMPNSSALYFQGTLATNGGAGAPFGDGLRCASGAVVRLGIRTNASNESAYPGVGDPMVSVRGGCAPGDVRAYQTWYRNAAAFCTPSTFNLTNGLLVAWAP